MSSQRKQSERMGRLRMHKPKRSAKALLQCNGLRKSYRKAKVEIPVLRGVDFQIGAGEFTSIVGQSGSGKSTLLHLLATLDQPDAGEIHFEGNRIDNLPPRGREIRSEIGL